jgi:hypothetical protein
MSNMHTFHKWLSAADGNTNSYQSCLARLTQASRKRGRPNRVVEVQRATGSEAAATGANRHAVVEPKGRTGVTDES